MQTILHLGTPTKNDENYYTRWEEIGQVTTNYISSPTIVYGDWRTDWTGINWHNVQLIVCPSTGTEYAPKRNINASNPLPIISLKNAPILKDVRGVSEWCLLRILKYCEDKSLAVSGLKVLLIGGNGRIGIHLTEILLAMKAYVLVHDLNKPFKMNLEESIKWADIISIHIPLEGNEGFYNKQLLHLTKDKLLINSSRPQIVNNSVNDLVYEDYLNYAHDFSDYDCFYTTKHIAGSKTKYRIMTDEWLVSEVKNYLQQPAKTQTQS